MFFMFCVNNYLLFKYLILLFIIFAFICKVGERRGRDQERTTRVSRYAIALRIGDTRLSAPTDFSYSRFMYITFCQQ